MVIAVDAAAALVLGFVAWIVGLHVFDAVHWGLHGLLRSRWRLLRALAAPHALHHAWLDGQLRTRWEYQTKNLWGHIVLEFATQLVFSVLLLAWLPVAAVVVCVTLQVVVFAFIASQRGLDVNHRPIEILDAYTPSALALPAYHALHHVYPNAYYSAYSKLVDYVVGGGMQLAGRRFCVVGDNALAGALAAQLGRAGGDVAVELDRPAAGSLGSCDVLVLASPGAGDAASVEALVAAVGDRQLPPEVWVVHTAPPDATARHYYRDPRVGYRVLAVAPEDVDAPDAARRAARRLMFFARRGLNFAPSRSPLLGYRAYRRFRALAPECPPGVPNVRSRKEIFSPV